MKYSFFLLFSEHNASINYRLILKWILKLVLKDLLLGRFIPLGIIVILLWVCTTMSLGMLIIFVVITYQNIY